MSSNLDPPEMKARSRRSASGSICNRTNLFAFVSNLCCNSAALAQRTKFPFQKNQRPSSCTLVRLMHLHCEQTLRGVRRSAALQGVAPPFPYSFQAASNCKHTCHRRWRRQCTPFHRRGTFAAIASSRCSPSRALFFFGTTLAQPGAAAAAASSSSFPPFRFASSSTVVSICPLDRHGVGTNFALVASSNLDCSQNKLGSFVAFRTSELFSSGRGSSWIRSARVRRPNGKDGWCLRSVQTIASAE